MYVESVQGLRAGNIVNKRNQLSLRRSAVSIVDASFSRFTRNREKFENAQCSLWPEMGGGSENGVERKSRVLRRESNQVNASLNHCDDVQMGQRVVNKIDLNIFCAKENNDTRDMSPSEDNNINVTLPQDDKVTAKAGFQLKLCDRTFCGRKERRFLLKLTLFLCCVCLFVTVLYVFTRPPGKS